ncbi:MAG: glycosyltransferase family 4 protein [Candidatus Diapherotrites archaeon]|nr:glycosyltransferase family 4 protein [Candidatus Diapherotrites archaeon]
MVKIRVLRIAPEFYEQNVKGGLSQHVVSLSKELKKLGIKQTILTTAGNSKKFPVFFFKPEPPLSQIRSGDFAFYRFKEIENTLKENFDIVHIHNPHFYRFLLHKKELNAKTVVTLHGSAHLSLEIALKRHLFNFNKLRQNLYFYYSAKRVAELADALAVLNQYEFEKFKEEKPRAKLFKLSSGVDTRIFKPRNLRKEYGVISVSRFVPTKRIDVLIKAAALLKKKFPKLRLLLVGASKQDESYSEIISLIKRLKLQRNVEILSYVQPKELPKLYNKAKIFAFASEFEGMPKVILEAMASGLAVVAYNIPGVKDALGREGILLNENSPIAFANAIELLLNNEVLLQQIAENLLKRAKLFEWTNVARENLKIYKRLLS